MFINFHHIKGQEKDSDINLNYIPPSRLTLWPKFSLGNFWLEPKVIFTAPQKNPGPLEQEIDGYSLVNAIFGYKLSPKVTCLSHRSKSVRFDLQVISRCAGCGCSRPKFCFQNLPFFVNLKLSRMAVVSLSPSTSECDGGSTPMRVTG